MWLAEASNRHQNQAWAKRMCVCVRGCVCLCFCLFVCVCVYVRALVHTSVSRWHLSVCSPTTVPVPGSKTSSNQERHWQWSARSTFYYSEGACCNASNLAFWHRHSQHSDIRSIENGVRKAILAEQDSTTIHMNCTINSNRVSQP